MNHIERILKGFPFVVLDGGLATELEKLKILVCDG